jgi:hypothetical protein
MSTTSSGIFSVREFNYRRNVLKLAPDAYISINNATTARIVSPMDKIGSKDTDVRGGVTSISVNSAVSPAGASRATVEIVAPQYKGLHEDYYMTLPNGTKTPVFTPMMEIRIYMKGRFLEEEYKWGPRYYPVFWGMITSIQENYSSGASTFSLTCEDLLCWWRYQTVAVQQSVSGTLSGGAPQGRFPSVFQNMSPWEILLSLFSDNLFTQVDEQTGMARHYNFVQAQWSNAGQLPNTPGYKETWGPFSQSVMDYWNQRFGFGVLANGTSGDIAASFESIPLEMYGLQGPIKWQSLATRLLSFLDTTKGSLGAQTSNKVDLDLDFGMLARVQPYGLFDLFGDGSEAQHVSRLEIANVVCEKVNLEFFVDTNGNFVIKPPLYNLDVASGDVPYYKIGPEEIINFNSSFDSNAIINYLVVTGPMLQQVNIESIGFHADFESIKKYGLHSDKVAVSYGMNANQLRMIAAAEMTRRNGQAFSGSVSIPLRPELRLGYPIYLPHIDTFYYVTGISHNYSYGSTATTDLSIQYRRERIFEDGTSGLPGSVAGDVLDKCVYRERDAATVLSNAVKASLSSSKDLNISTDQAKVLGLDPTATDYQAKLESFKNDLKKQAVQKDGKLYAGPDLLGYWKLDKARASQTSESISKAGTAQAISSNELVMITDTTVPYTDLNGYRHIGAFPFGANLVVMKNGQVFDSLNHVQRSDLQTATQINATGTNGQTTSQASSSVANSVAGQPSTAGAPKPNQPSELTESQAQERVDSANKVAAADLYTPSLKFLKGSAAEADATSLATNNLLNYSYSSVGAGSGKSFGGGSSAGAGSAGKFGS